MPPTTHSSSLPPTDGARPVGKTEFALPNEPKPAFFAYAIYCHEVDVILERSRVWQVFRKRISAWWPICWQQHEVRASERQNTRCFGERSVVADMNADLHTFNVVDLHRSITACYEAIDTEKRQMNLAINTQDPRGTKQHATVEQVFAWRSRIP